MSRRQTSDVNLNRNMIENFIYEERFLLEFKSTHLKKNRENS